MQHWSLLSVKPGKLQTATADGYGHFSIAPESFRRGLVWLFN